MGHTLHDPVRHNSWANRTLLEFLREYDEETLNQTIPNGTYGSIIDTLRHTINAEASYLRRLTGAWEAVPWDPASPVSIAELLDRNKTLTDVWETFLAADAFDTEALGEGRGDAGETFAVRASIFVTQALHHGSEHRAQVCGILGTLGIEPPELSGWLYAIETGRAWVKTTGEPGA